MFIQQYIMLHNYEIVHNISLFIKPVHVTYYKLIKQTMHIKSYYIISLSII